MKEDGKNSDDIAKRIYDVQDELCLLLDASLLEFAAAYEDGRFRWKAAAPISARTLENLRKYVAEKIGDTEECMEAVEMFVGGYINGRIAISASCSQDARQRNGSKYRVSP